MRTSTLILALSLSVTHLHLTCMEEQAKKQDLIVHTLEAAYTLASTDTQSLKPYSFAPSVIACYVRKHQLDNLELPQDDEIAHFAELQLNNPERYTELSNKIFKRLKCYNDGIEKKDFLTPVYARMFNEHTKKVQKLITTNDQTKKILPRLGVINGILGIIFFCEAIILVSGGSVAGFYIDKC